MMRFKNSTSSLSFWGVAAIFVWVLLVSGNCFFVLAEESDKALAIATKEMDKNAALLGRLFPMFSKLFIRDTSKSSFSFKEVFNAVMKCVDNREVAIFAVVGWGLVPLTQSVYDLYTNLTHSNIQAEESSGAAAAASDGKGWFKSILKKEDEPKKEKGKMKQKIEQLTPWDDDKLNEQVHKAEDKIKEQVHKAFHGEIKPFQETLSFHVADHISQASRIGILVMTVDVSRKLLFMIFPKGCYHAYTSCVITKQLPHMSLFFSVVPSILDFHTHRKDDGIPTSRHGSSLWNFLQLCLFQLDCLQGQGTQTILP